MGVYATKDFEKHALTLVPLTTSVAFKEVVPLDAVALSQKMLTPQGNKCTLALMKPKLRLPTSIDKKTTLGFVAHFWEVIEAPDAKSSNMQLQTSECGIPVLRNHKDIQAGELLQV